jgi:hypothetical protein
MIRKIVWIAVAVSCSLQSCFMSKGSLNEPLREHAVEGLVPGTTTASEVTARLGAPNEVVQLGQRTAYRYDFTNKKTAGFTLIVVTFLNEDTRSDRIWFFFDAKDVLTHAGATFEGDETEYSMPWDDTEGD